jgi:hypothetical protein
VQTSQHFIEIILLKFIEKFYNCICQGYWHAIFFSLLGVIVFAKGDMLAL